MPHGAGGLGASRRSLQHVSVRPKVCNTSSTPGRVWDRVPDAENLAQLSKPELLLMLSEALDIQRDQLRRHAMVREAVHLVGPDTDRLLASRIYGALGKCWLFTDDTVDEAEAVRLSLELAGDEPSEELAHALDAKARYLDTPRPLSRRRLPGKHAPSMWRDPVGSAATLTSALVLAAERSLVPGRGRRGRSPARPRPFRSAVRPAVSGRRWPMRGISAWLLLLAGRVEEAASLAREFLDGRSTARTRRSRIPMRRSAPGAC